MKRRSFLMASAALTWAAWAGAAEPKRILVRGGKLLGPDGKPKDDQSVLVDDGRIASVGAGGAADLTIDAKGKWVSAGFVDLLTGVGLAEISLERESRDDLPQADDDDPVRAAFLAADGYNPASSVIPVTRIEGVTSVGVVPRGGLVSGQSAWADLVGATPEEALRRRQLALHVFLDDAELGGTELSRGTAMLRLRELIEDARAYRQNPGAFQRNQMYRLSASRLDLAAVDQALGGQIRTVFHVDRASDILAVLELAKREKLRAVLASAAEGWKVAQAIAAANVPAIVYPLDNLPHNFSARGARSDNAALLRKAGVQVGLSTGETHNARKLRQVAGNAVRAGLPHADAVRAVTLTAAEAVGMDKTHGSIEPGKQANLVVWSGDPFELSTRAEHVIIGGRPVPLASRQTALFERYRKRSD